MTILPFRKPAKHTPKIYTKLHSPRYNKISKFLIQLTKLEAKLIQKPVEEEFYLLSKTDQELIEHCFSYWNSSSTTDNSTDINSFDIPIKEKLTQLLEEIQLYMTKASHNSLQSRLLAIKSASNQNLQGMIKRVLERKTDFRGVSFLVEENLSSLTSDPRTVDQQLYKFYSTLFKSNQSTSINPSKDWQPYYESVVTPLTVQSMLLNRIQPEEIFEIVRNASNDSASGPDLIPWSLLKLINEDHTFWKSLQKELSQILETGDMPHEWNKGITILLTKIEPFNGDQNKLRPICLLNTLRKIMTGIIDNRLKQYVESNNLLIGTNFGFRKGMSTSNSLFTIKSIIDLADRRKDPLYLILLDIQKAYDTVPSEALKLALQRIGIPTKLIAVILSINRSLLIKVQHYYGNTQQFPQSNGLPQGDKYSPILWLIFYDPLLARLTQETTGFIVTNQLSVTHLGFADDLKLLSTCHRDSRDQLVIVGSFLDLNQMKANTEKTLVAINRHANFPTKKFTLQGKELIAYIKPSELVRILGVFLTLDGKQIETIKHAVKYFNVAISQLYSHYTPGPLATYIVNMVIIPVLSYRLQITYVPPSTIHKLDGRIRKLIRHKYHLPRQIPSSLLYSSQGGIKLQSLESTLQRNLVTDSLVHIRSSNITSKVLRFGIQYFSDYAKLPESLTVCPINFKQLQTVMPKTRRLPSRVPLVFHISNALAMNSLQFRTMADHQSSNINRLMDMNYYPLYFKSWKHLKAIRLEDISGLPNQGFIEEFFPDSLQASFSERFQRETYFIGKISLQAYIQRLSMQAILHDEDQLNKLGRLFGGLIYSLNHRFIYPHENLAHSSLTTNASNSLEFIGTVPLLNTTKPDSLVEKPSAPLRSLKINPSPPHARYNSINAYTDGSLITSPRNPSFPLVGTSTIFVHEYSAKWCEWGKPQVTKISQHLPFLPIIQPSSTTVEALALQTAILHAPSDFELHIYSDSQNAISSQTKFSSFAQLTPRETLKIPNALLYSINNSLISQRKGIVNYKHIKAHTDSQDTHSRFNNKADELAKASANPGLEDYEENKAAIDKMTNEIYYKQFTPYIPVTIAYNHQHTQLFENGIISLQYPRKHIKKQFYNQQDQVLYSKLRAAHTNIFPSLPAPTDRDLILTLKLSSARSTSSHFLDASYIREDKFRRNLIINQLPTMTLFYQWNTTKRTFADHPFCHWCKEQGDLIPESFDHLWECQVWQTKYKELHDKILCLLASRYKILKGSHQLDSLYSLLGLHSATCLPSLTSNIFHMDTNSIYSKYTGNLTKEKLTALLYSILECFFSAYYTLIWLPRCRIIHSGKDPPTYTQSSAKAAQSLQNLPPQSKKRNRQKETYPRDLQNKKRNCKSPEEIDLFSVDSASNERNSDTDHETNCDQEVSQFRYSLRKRSLQQPSTHSTKNFKRFKLRFTKEKGIISSVIAIEFSSTDSASDASYAQPRLSSQYNKASPRKKTNTVVINSTRTTARTQLKPPKYQLNYFEMRGGG
jgi:hypothetical protein